MSLKLAVWLSGAALTLTTLVGGAVGMHELQVADRDSKRQEQQSDRETDRRLQLKGLQDEVADLSRRLALMEAKQDRTINLMETIAASETRRRGGESK